jgi:hypothetical protein
MNNAFFVEIRQWDSKVFRVWWEQVSVMLNIDPVTKELSRQSDSGQMFIQVNS